MTKQYMRRIPMGLANQSLEPSTTTAVISAIAVISLVLWATGRLDSQGAAMRAPTDSPVFF